MSQTLSTDELLGWLRLSMEPELGPVGARRLLSAFGLPENIFAQGPQALRPHVGDDLALRISRPAQAETRSRMETALRWLDHPDHHLVVLADKTYPQALLHLHDPPVLLYAQGRLSLLNQPALAIVGARSATAGGLDNARAFARYLAERGWTIVSGLAEGIDTAAHEGALQAGAPGGSTIAVLGTGIDTIYPARNRRLAASIAVHGLLLTELLPGTPARSWNFPRRNRLVAALGKGVLVVEAARQSGSLITARLATELGREVFAIPGSIHSPLSRGCHALIRQGAKLVEAGQDIHDELQAPDASAQPGHTKTAQDDRHAAEQAIPPSPAQAPLFADPGSAQPGETGQATDSRAHTSSGGSPRSPDPTWLDADTRVVLEAIGFDPVHPDQILARTGLDMPQLASALTQLELAGAITRQQDGRYQCL